MKTIFIPIFYKQQARNILETDVFRILAAAPGLRVVLFVPEFKRAYFERFRRPNVAVEPIAELPEPFSRLDALFHSIALSYIDSRTLRIFRAGYGLRAKDPFRFWARTLATRILGRAAVLRRISRALDAMLVRDHAFGRFFDRYQPDLVFCPHLISKYDRSLLRQARRRGVRTIGAVNSWDNITAVKNPIRILPDVVMAYNEIIKAECMRYLDVPLGRIAVTGLPHYDYYVARPRAAREEFFARIGADPSRRFILFSPAGKAESDTDWQIVSILQDAIGDGRLPNAQLLVRQHPVSDMAMGELRPAPFVIFDKPFTAFSGGGRRFREITAEDMDHLADTLYWSDVTINICSTLTIDAAAFDKPVVNVAFDGWVEKPYKKSIRRFYDHDHYQPILRSGGVRVARSPEELLGHVRAYLDDPRLDREGRLRIVREQCGQLDGKAGERLAHMLLNHLGLSASRLSPVVISR